MVVGYPPRASGSVPIPGTRRPRRPKAPQDFDTTELQEANAGPGATSLRQLIKDIYMKHEPTTAVQVAIAQILGGTAPGYRHHLLLLEERGGKLAKLHGAVGFEALSARYSGGEFCGLLAEACGLRPRARAVHPAELLAAFRWDQVRAADRTVTWDGQALGLGA